MATYERTLTRPPNGERDLELWIQHAAGLLIFEDVRNYAIEQLDANMSEFARSAALKAIDHAVYGMMMVIDGVSGALKNEKHRVSLAVAVQLTDLETDETIAEFDLADGDGMCMGYH
ncbi:hypothetical protein Pla52o_55070 [Novipirellula galeiformis]|uniref:Uncharacterized protein n=1 Tax=Novipirellula galeiformis TaxID=2528004 RepID=A0A5C6BIK0_9BACT|nr:hypothetical protein [Novipirellula galeiformis]TWU10284.1 hypothetical protein Pla52o_57400 [Novipirellula galeiformis]TWU17168.1 hypothetical protein Pla52o_55070 [Novipirellula galeiformis]